MIGRAAGLLVDLPVQVQPTGWRLTDAPGRDLRRARDHLSRDLDALEELAGAYTGPLKIQVAGVWTLAGSIELPRGERILSDPGAVRDLAGSLAEGMKTHIAQVRRRVPGARLLVQVDEPGLPGVLAGSLPTASGLHRIRPVEAPIVQQTLAELLAVITGQGADPVVHCCGPVVPLALLHAAGARAVSAELRAVRRAGEDALGEAVQAGVGLLMGVLPGVAPAAGGGLSDPATTVDGVRETWRRLGFRAEDLPKCVVVTPVCGLAGASPGYVREVLGRCRAAGHVLRDEPEG